MTAAVAISTAAPDGSGPLHGLDARAKLIAFVGLVVITVTVPSTHHVGLAGCAALVILLVLVARVRIGDLGHRLLHLAPFLLVAAVLPFTRPEGGMNQAIGEVAKAMIGCLALVLLGATTPVDQLLSGLVGLRCPGVVVLLLSLLIRYLHLLRDEARRLRRAATARGYAPRSLAQVTALGYLIGALFLRSHARAERVHAAMMARGFTGEVVSETPPAMTMMDYAFLTIVLGVAVVWRVLGP